MKEAGWQGLIDVFRGVLTQFQETKRKINNDFPLEYVIFFRVVSTGKICFELTAKFVLEIILIVIIDFQFSQKCFNTKPVNGK